MNRDSEFRDQRILVTGGAGFIGSHLVDALAKENEVIVVDDLSTGSVENLQEAVATGRVTLKEQDIRRKDNLSVLFQGVDTVFHLATQCVRISLSNPELVHEVNSTGTLNVLLAAQKAKVKRFINVSSSEVYGSAEYVPMDEKHPAIPRTVYGASKFVGELYTQVFFKTYGLPALIVRPFNTYGPRSHFEGYSGEVIPKFVVRVLGGKPPVIFGNGEQTRDFTYISDTVRGILQAGACDALLGGIVNIAYGREVSVNELAKATLEITGCTHLKPIYASPRPGDVLRHSADIRLAQNMLGFKPQVSIREGLKIYIDWFRTNFEEKIAACLSSEVEQNW